MIKKHNAIIIGVARNADKPERGRKLSGDNIFCYQMDVSDKFAWQNFKTYLCKNDIKPDVIINNAGCISAYCASKSVIRSFSEALAVEQKRVYVGYVMPGCCKTQLFSESITCSRDKKLFGKTASTPQKFAKKIVRRLERKKRRSVIGFDAKAMDVAYRLFPTLSLKIIAKNNKNGKIGELFRYLRRIDKKVRVIG